MDTKLLRPYHEFFQRLKLFNITYTGFIHCGIIRRRRLGKAEIQCGRPDFAQVCAVSFQFNFSETAIGCRMGKHFKAFGGDSAFQDTRFSRNGHAGVRPFEKDFDLMIIPQADR